MNEIAKPSPRSREVASIASRACPEVEFRDPERTAERSAAPWSRAGKPEKELRDSSGQPELPIGQQIHRVPGIDRLHPFEMCESVDFSRHWSTDDRRLAADVKEIDGNVLGSPTLFKGTFFLAAEHDLFPVDFHR